MATFIEHALPWIIICVMVALTLAHYAKQK
jgi:hypothetical protein